MQWPKENIFRVVVPNIIWGIETDFAVNRKLKKIDTFLLYREHSWRHGGFSHAYTVAKKQSLYDLYDLVKDAHYNQFLYELITS